MRGSEHDGSNCDSYSSDISLSIGVVLACRLVRFRDDDVDGGKRRQRRWPTPSDLMSRWSREKGPGAFVGFRREHGVKSQLKNE